MSFNLIGANPSGSGMHNCIIRLINAIVQARPRVNTYGGISHFRIEWIDTKGYPGINAQTCHLKGITS